MTCHQRFNLLAAALVCLSAPASAAPEIVIGALESAQCTNPTLTGVRPLFVKSGSEWRVADDQAISALAAGADWTVALDGKSLGSLRTAGLFAEVPVLQAAEGQTIPLVGNNQQAFGGWCETPTRRPLAASTSAASADPDQWKPLKPAATVLASLLDAFRAQVGKTVLTCKGEATSPWAYEVTDLRLSGAYQDRQGRRLVGITLNAATNTCDGPLEPGWQPHWFVLTGENVAFLATNLQLVDAVDFDSDGASELLWWISDYNRDGYLLLDSALNVHLEQAWNYH